MIRNSDSRLRGNDSGIVTPAKAGVILGSGVLTNLFLLALLGHSFSTPALLGRGALLLISAGGWRAKGSWHSLAEESLALRGIRRLLRGIL